jgi:hypothetical protein
MRKIFVTLSVLLVLCFVACKGKDNTPSNKPTADSNSGSTTNTSEAADSAPPEMTVKVFKHSGLDFDSEGICVNGSMTDKEKITEVKKVEDGKPIKCSGGEYIQKLSVLGSAKPISIVFFDGKGKELHKLDEYSLTGEISFSTVNHQSDGGGGTNDKKDKDFAAWFESAEKMNILYQGKLIKELSWKNKGWYRQAGGME